MGFNTCVTQEDQNELFEIRKVLDCSQWLVGDIANRNYARTKDQFSFSYVCAAVGYYVGKSGATIQRWARTASFYDQPTREKYDGLLSFEHYAQACQYQDWESRLEKAAFGGRNEEPQTVDQMLADVYNPGERVPDNFPQPPETIISYDQEVPSVQITGTVSASIMAIFTLIGNIVQRLGITGERMEKVHQALNLLTEALVEKEPC